METKVINQSNLWIGKKVFLKKTLVHLILVDFNSGQNLWKNRAVNPSGSGVFLGLKEEKRVAIIFSSNGICVMIVIQSFISLEIILGKLTGGA